MEPRECPADSSPPSSTTREHTPMGDEASSSVGTLQSHYGMNLNLDISSWMKHKYLILLIKLKKNMYDPGWTFPYEGGGSSH